MYKRFKDFFTIGSLFLITVLVAAQLPGCSGGGSSGAALSTNSTRLQVSLTDKMSADYANVFIAIKEIRVVPAGMEERRTTTPACRSLKPLTHRSLSIFLPLDSSRRYLVQLICRQAVTTRYA